MPDQEKTTRVRLKVAVSEADMGQAGTAGDTVEMEAEAAKRWIEAGIAEPAGARRTAAAEDDDRTTGPRTADTPPADDDAMRRAASGPIRRDAGPGKKD